MNEITQKNNDFLSIYGKSHRLAAAVFIVSNIIDQGEELRTKIKNLSLELVSMSVKLKDINLLDTRKLITNLEKNSLELMSMLDIACVSGLISKMNSSVIKEEFRLFISELGKFSEGFENSKEVSVRGVFAESAVLNIESNYEKINTPKEKVSKNTNGHKRKDLRKNTVLDFIKGHNIVSIKDITANISGCSEKTIQRELLSLIKESKIKKTGERRWSKYSIL